MDPVETIQRLRGLGWTQEQIAEEIGATQARISRLVNGKVKKPDYKMVDAIRSLLGRPAPPRRPRQLPTQQHWTRARIPLTDEQILNICKSFRLGYTDIVLARAIERAHGIGVHREAV